MGSAVSVSTNVTELAEQLKRLGSAYDSYVPAIIDNAIDGNLLLNLKDEEIMEALKELGVDKTVHRRLLATKIFEARGRSPVTSAGATTEDSTFSAETQCPIYLVSLESLQLVEGFPSFPDDQELCVNLEDIDRSTAFVVFVSHTWLRSHSGAEGWDGRPHPDNAQHEKFKLTVEGVEKAWQSLAPRMTECYLWIDFSCDADPCGEHNQLDKIVQACDCIFTPIVDHDWELLGSALGATYSDWFEEYGAPLWRDGQYAYLNRAWCRMEMLYAANLDLHADVEQRRDNFAAGLRSAADRNCRPHLLYGHRESQLGGVGVQPIMLPLMLNNFAVTHSPSTGSITKESDRLKIEELMAELRIRPVVEGYEGERNDKGERHGRGKMTWADGDVYEGLWRNDERWGQGTFSWADGNVYDGPFENGERHGQGICRYADGDVYAGQWFCGKKHGRGTYRYANGDVYEGQFEHGVRHGRCVYRFADGRLYQGSFENDKRHGLGSYQWPNGMTYKGQYAQGLKHGQGKMTWTDGAVYEGQWENDKQHGQGRMTSASGGVFKEGRWERGNFVGKLFRFKPSADSSEEDEGE